VDDDDDAAILDSLLIGQCKSGPESDGPRRGDLTFLAVHTPRSLALVTSVGPCTAHGAAGPWRRTPLHRELKWQGRNVCMALPAIR